MRTGAVDGLMEGDADLDELPDTTEADPATDADLLPPDSDSDGSEGDEQSTGMQSKKVPSSHVKAKGSKKKEDTD